jgi:Protein of unknown function (DUF402)
VNVVWRETWRGRVWRAMACRLVQERNDDLVLWHPAGASGWTPYAHDGRKLRIPGDEDWELREARAPGASLGLIRLGRRWSIWHERDAHGAFAYWYVNFERDSRRTAVGVDLTDEKLDLVVAPDGSVRWKDEDELVEAARTGYLDEDEVRAEAARVLADPPWPTGWEDWVADPTWDTPSLPEGWNVV